MGRFFKYSFLLLVIVAAIGIAGAGLTYLLRPSPASGTATIPAWVKTLDDARPTGPSLALKSFTLSDGRGYPMLRDAVSEARDGDTIDIAPGVYTRDCAVVHSGKNLKFRALVAGTVTFRDAICEGKAVLVLRGGAITVEGLRFSHVKTDDANAAGIRIEGGDLFVRDSTFEDSENGILGNENPDGSVTIERSIFRRLGGCPPDKLCAHSLYLGRIGKISVSRSLFEEGRGGHYLKLRGPQVDVRDNLIDDSKGKTTSYLIDMPNGATGTVSGNTMVKGRRAENRCCAILVGEEGVKTPTTVAIQGNTAVNLSDRPVILVADLTGTAQVAANDTRGWWVTRTGMTYKGRCLGCGALR